MSDVNKVVQAVALISITLILGHVFVVGLFNMSSGSHGSMLPCPFMNGSTLLCGMSVLDHMANWQLLFTTLPLRSNIPLLLVSLLALFFFAKNFIDRRTNLSTIGYFSLLAHEHREERPIFLTEMFSQGILHPRLYSV